MVEWRKKTNDMKKRISKQINDTFFSHQGNYRVNLNFQYHKPLNALHDKVFDVLDSFGM